MTDKRATRPNNNAPKPPVLGISTWLAILVVVSLGVLFALFHERWLNDRANLDTSVSERGKFEVLVLARRSSERDNFNNFNNSISHFFSHIRSDSKPLSETSDPYVLTLPETPYSLLEVVEQLRSENRQAGIPALAEDWNGVSDERWFMEGDTLKQKLEETAQQESIHLVWWLPHDYLIKSPFSVAGNVTDLFREVATTVNNDYGSQVSAYLCQQSRALIIADDNEIDDIPDRCLNMIANDQPLESEPEALPNLQLKRPPPPVGNESR